MPWNLRMTPFCSPKWMVSSRSSWAIEPRRWLLEALMRSFSDIASSPAVQPQTLHMLRSPGCRSDGLLGLVAYLQRCHVRPRDADVPRGETDDHGGQQDQAKLGIADIGKLQPGRQQHEYEGQPDNPVRHPGGEFRADDHAGEAAEKDRGRQLDLEVAEEQVCESRGGDERHRLRQVRPDQLCAA